MRKRYAVCAYNNYRALTRHTHPVGLPAAVVIAITIGMMPGCGSGVVDSTGTLGSSLQVASPVFVTSEDTGLLDTLDVQVTCETPGAVIHYTTDDTDPDETSSVCTDKITITETTTIKVRAYHPSLAPSDVVEATYSISGYELGMLALDPTEYSAIPPALVPAMGELPTKIDLSPYFPRPGNQGQQGSCVGWAVAYALKTYQENVERGWGADQPDTQFSPSYMYNQIKIGGCNSGAYLSHAFRLLEEQGCATLADMPYDQGDCAKEPSEEAYTEAYTYRIDSSRRVSAQDITELKAQLAAGLPVVIGARIYTNFFYIRDDTVYDSLEGSWQGNHALCVVGYDDASSSFLVINSWGRGWGAKGFCRISYDVLQQMVFEAYVSQDIVENTYVLTTSVDGEGSLTVEPDGDEYYQGEVVQLTAKAASGWSFARWEGDLSGWANPMAVVMDDDKSVTAVFERGMQTLTIQVVGDGLTDPPAGTHEYYVGDTVVISALTVDSCEGWAFDNWSGDASGEDVYTVVTMDADMRVVAEFVATNHAPVAHAQTLSTDDGAPVDITLAGHDTDEDTLIYVVTSNPANGTLNVANAPIVTYTPNAGFVGNDTFQFTVNDGCSDSEPAEVSVYVGAPIQYKVSVDVAGSGTVEASPEGWYYEAGTEVTLTAIAADGAAFGGFSGDVVGTDTAITFTVEDNMDVVATFGVPLTITVTPADSGTITLDPPGGMYDVGDWVTITASPTGGNKFVEWTGDLTGTDRIRAIQIESATTAEAVFTGSPPSVSLLGARTLEPWVVQFDMRIHDSGGRAIVEGVTADDFKIYEDDDLLDYTETNQFVTPGPALPMKVMLVLDYTNSMHEADAIDEMIDAAGQFVGATSSSTGEAIFTGSHTMGVVEFHDRLDEGEGFNLVAPLTRTDSVGKASLISAMPCATCREHGLTRVWDAVDLAITEILDADSQSGEARAVVFLTDGEDTTSVVTTSALLTRAVDNGVMLYPIGFGDVTDNEADLQEMASETGGMYYPAASATSLQAIFTEIARDLNGQWNLTYITQRNTGTVPVTVEFTHEGQTTYTYTFDAAAIAGDIHTGHVRVLERTYDADTDRTSFLLKAEYMPRNITYFHFQFDHADATFALQGDGGLLDNWTSTKLGDGDFELQGDELGYGAFGNIGVVTVGGEVNTLRAVHDDDNDVYNDLYLQYGVTKKIELEGTLVEGF